jgi:uncharacterized protein
MSTDTGEEPTLTPPWFAVCSLVLLLLGCGKFDIERRDEQAKTATPVDSTAPDSSAAIDSSALATAALNGRADQVRMLLAAGANPNADGGHALSQAALGCQRRNNTDVIRVLLEGGALPTIPGVEYTPLHRAAALCESEAVRILLQRRANPNAHDVNGVTPLMSAASAGKLENVRLLIGAGANVNARDAEGRTAIDHAAERPKVQEELRRAGAG